MLLQIHVIGIALILLVVSVDSCIVRRSRSNYYKLTKKIRYPVLDVNKLMGWWLECIDIWPTVVRRSLWPCRVRLLGMNEQRRVCILLDIQDPERKGSLTPVNLSREAAFELSEFGVTLVDARKDHRFHCWYIATRWAHDKKGRSTEWRSPKTTDNHDRISIAYDMLIESPMWTISPSTKRIVKRMADTIFHLMIGRERTDQEVLTRWEY